VRAAEIRTRKFADWYAACLTNICEYCAHRHAAFSTSLFVFMQTCIKSDTSSCPVWGADFPREMHLGQISFSMDSHKPSIILLLFIINNHMYSNKYMVVSCLPWVQGEANISLWLWLRSQDDEVESFHPYVLYPLWYGLALNYVLSFFTPSDDLSLAAVVPCPHNRRNQYRNLLFWHFHQE